MFKQSIIVAAALGVSSLLAGVAMAAEPVKDQTQARQTLREPVYGSQLMTAEERRDYRQKMQSMKTQEEREAFRADHHKLMQDRATEKGMALPDMPTAKGMGRPDMPAAADRGMGGQQENGGKGNGMGQGMRGR